MSSLNIFVGAPNNLTPTELLDFVDKKRPWVPFDDRAVSLISKLSSIILKNPKSKYYPEIVSLGHWFRAARLRDLKNIQTKENVNKLRVGRGLVFHIAPSNVDSVSMYSWILSFLAGNINIVRISQKRNEQLDFILEVLHSALNSDDNTKSACFGRFVILTYPHDDAITTLFSRECMQRVVWGGDRTVTDIRRIELRPTALEICFPDRFSVAAIKATSVIVLRQEEIVDLAKKFYNDAFWFAQQACSSPRVLYWVGEEHEIASAKLIFWEAVQRIVEGKNEQNTAAMNMSRLVASFEMASRDAARLDVSSSLSAYPFRLIMKNDLNSVIRDAHCGNGLFLEASILQLHEMAQQLSDKEQTLSVFGFNQDEIIGIVEELPARALDRVVPFGEALSFDSVWDGLDLINTFSRQITITASK